MFVGTQYYRPPFPEKRHWPEDLARIRDAGLEAVQFWLCWGWIESRPGEYRYDDYDELVALAEQHGLRVVLSTIAEIHVRGECARRSRIGAGALRRMGRGRVSIRGLLTPEGAAASAGKEQAMIKANLVHLSYNMWGDRPFRSSDPPERRDWFYDPQLRFDERLWRDVVERMAEAGMNMLVLDVGDGIVCKSHPEIAVEGAWSPAKAREELAYCRGLGIEPVPKLNFSACHDAWLGPYCRRLSAPDYYTLCADLIHEVADIFSGPRLFHIGMDEETWDHQRDMLYVVVRQGELWWHDLNFLVETVEQTGARAWVWSDVVWRCDRAVFRNNMPASVLQSNWYYGDRLPLPDDDPQNYVRAYHWLDEMGYDQVPTGSTWSHPANYARTVEYCGKHISAERLLGFMMTTWHPTVEGWGGTLLDAVRAAASAHPG